MSTVWRAHDERLGRTVAIKVMADSLAADPGCVTRFAREARTHAGIVHPNLVRVHDFSVTAAQPYLVMEYIQGSTLSQRVDNGGLGSAALTRLTHDVLSAIGCVHDHGVLHRDIKPANVLLDLEGRALLTDFGIARLEDSTRLTHPGDIVGTLRFLAPELIHGQPPTRQSDLFALGVLLRTVAGGQELFPEMRELIEWLSSTEPSERPSDAHAALRSLQPQPLKHVASARWARSARSSTTAAATRSERRPRRLRPRSLAVAGVAVIALVGVAVAESGGGGHSGNARSAATLVGKKGQSASKAKNGGSASKDVVYTTKLPSQRPTLDQRFNSLEATVKGAAKR
jgi:serine/threonine protein kinase